MSKRPPKLRKGQQAAPHLTVLGTLDEGGNDPVYVVWHHRAWCVMCCKVYRRPTQATWEREALGRLAHPGIVRLLEDGTPRYLLTEFLEGPTLRGLVRSQARGCLGVDDALRVAAHLGAALAHMHDRGLLHLDVKTTNVIVTRGRPVLIDLGSARAADGKQPSSPQGTDAYMAPELCRAEVPGPTSDVWSLAITLFELLTGERPFPKGDNSRPFPQLEMPPIPLRRLRPRAPAALERLILDCLAPRPEDRPSSMAQLLPRLNAHIRHGPRMWPDDLDGREVPTKAP